MGAKVNGRLILLTRAWSGETVEVVTPKPDKSGLSRDWLAFASCVRAKIKQGVVLLKERREEAIESRQSVAHDA